MIEIQLREKGERKRFDRKWTERERSGKRKTNRQALKPESQVTSSKKKNVSLFTDDCLKLPLKQSISVMHDNDVRVYSSVYIFLLEQFYWTTYTENPTFALDQKKNLRLMVRFYPHTQIRFVNFSDTLNPSDN